MSMFKKFKSHARVPLYKSISGNFNIGMLSIKFVMDNMTLCLHFDDVSFNGSLTRDFRLQAFFMAQFSHGPWVSQLGPLQIFTKFAEIFESKGWSLVSTRSAINGKILRQEFFLIVSGVVDTGEQLITVANTKLRITPPQIFEKNSKWHQ